MDDSYDFTPIRLDILREIGNIGTGNAVTSLSKMMGKKVTMQTPVINMVEFKNIAEFLGGPEQVVIGILVGLSGDINGIMMFLTRKDTAHKLVAMLMGAVGAELPDEDDFTEMELSALEEIGNILTSSYLGSLAGLIGKTVKPSSPFLSMDMANAVLSVPAIEFGKAADSALIIETLFEAEGENVSGYFILVPDPPSFQMIMSSLGAG
ncbi:MAG: chemotaxis protein CheC [Defluviitaleaceae bacterium]|nr:chemotaxis protein CheC [Defluviitaleaceae bacterium]